MAKDIGDKTFEKKCSEIAAMGYKNISGQLFNGEYFFQITDPEHLEAPNTNKGCHAEQLVGQYWARQAGLPDIAPENQIKAALQSIVKYNFQENYGNYLDTATIKVSRYYALPDEPALITCSFPKGGANLAPGKIKSEWEKLVVGYFSEPWTGQEHHVAATLISHGLVNEGLMIEKAVHRRYTPGKRNPYNEIEYGNHYTRAMSGLAPFISASGFIFHGPKGEIGFDPKVNPEDFKSAFITGESWGSFAQKRRDTRQENSLEIVYGKLRLTQLSLGTNGTSAKNVHVVFNGKNIPVTSSETMDNKLTIKFDEINLREGDVLRLWIN